VKKRQRILQQFDPQTRLLGLIAIALALALLIEASLVSSMPYARSAENALPPPAAVSPVPQSVSPPMPPLAAYREIMQRPLFSDTRRPVEVSTPMTRAPALQDPATKWTLTGIVASAGESRAVVTGIKDKTTRRLAQGEMLDGWRLAEIEAYRLRFESADGEAFLELLEDQGR